VPSHFRMPDDEVRSFLRAPGAGDLVTWSAEHGLEATFLPWVHVGVGDGWGSLHGHLARANPHWRHAPDGQALVVLHGPHGYVSPSWYASKAEHGRVVPTWDHVTLHVHGELVVHEEPADLRRLVESLTDLHEAGRPDPWAVDDAPDGYVDKTLRAIVGVEVRISRIEASAKLSQNRSADDVRGVVSGLRAAGEDVLADAVDAADPHRD